MKSSSPNNIKCDNARILANKLRWNTFNRFVDEKVQILKASEALLWLILFRHANMAGEVTLSMANMCASTGLGRRTVQRAIRGLEDAGLLATIKRGGPNAGIAKYRITTKRKVV